MFPDVCFEFSLFPSPIYSKSFSSLFVVWVSKDHRPAPGNYLRQKLEVGATLAQLCN